MSTVFYICYIKDFEIIATLLLSLSSKLDKVTRKSEILIRFVGGRNFIFRSKSGLFISKGRWNEIEGKIIIHRLAKAEQKILVKLQSDIDRLKNIIIESVTSVEKSKIDKGWLKTEIKKFHHSDKYSTAPIKLVKSFMEQFNYFLNVRKLSVIRRNNFNVVGRILQRFEIFLLAIRDENFDLAFETITYEILLDFNDFLSAEHLYSKEPEYKIICDSFP